MRRKLKNRLLLLIFSLSFVISVVALEQMKDERWIKIENYNISLDKRDYEFEDMPISIVERQTGDEFKDIINTRQVIALQKLLRNEVPFYETPYIKTIIKTNILREYDVYDIGNQIRKHHNWGFDCAIEKNGKSIHRFGWFELEDVKMYLGYKKSDIDFINKMLKTEKINIDNPALVLNWIELFLLLNGGRSWDTKILKEKGEIEDLIKINCKDKAEMVYKDIENLINPPLYSRGKDKLKLKFWMSRLAQRNKDRYSEEEYFLLLRGYVFEIDKKLKINPPPNILYIWVDLLKDCACKIKTYENK